MVDKTLAHFHILKKLGAGGMGDVYLAQDARLGRSVALKVLSRNTESDPGGTAQLVREARAASSLNHPNVAAIYDIGEADGVRFIVMEYVDGETLSARIAGQGFDTSGILAIATQLADVLCAAHAKGITHRDIKPGNIMFTSEGQLKVLDFGLAKIQSPRSEQLSASSDSTEVTETLHHIIGTLAYMSPEQAIGRAVDHRTDIFSLGVVLYQLATSALPFTGATPIETIDCILRREPEPIARFNHNVHPEMERIIEKCLEKEVKRRYQNASDLLVDLRNLEREMDGGGPKVTAYGRERQGSFAGQLPVQMTSFVGREREVAEVKRLLSASRLLTLTGVAGTGKTRLSLQVASEVWDQFPDGVWQVELAPLSDPDLVQQAVASAMGVREVSDRTLLRTLSDYLRAKSLLLVIDNCEHLLLACAQLAESLLGNCPKLRILATSREGLRIAGEMIYSVPALSLPDDPAHGPRPDVSNLTQSEAGRLFIDRAALIQPRFAVTNMNAAAIAQICHRLDGIPLAIELAAARVKALSAEQICGRLDDRFHLLTGGVRTALPRQQTLRALVDWSHDLLSEKEKTLWRRLSVFAGGWTLEAAEFVTAGNGLERHEVLDLLSHLVEKSLVNTKPEAAGTVRYSLLETIRQYGRQKLAETEEGGWLRTHHLEYFMQLAERAEPQLFVASQVWLDAVEQEYDNIREALEWGMELQTEPALGLRLVGAIWMFWFVRCFLSEGRQWAEAAVQRSEQAEPAIRAKVLVGAARLAFNQGDHARASALCKQCLDLQPRIGLERPQVLALMNLGNCYQYYVGDLTQALEYHEQSLDLSKKSGEKWLLALSLVNLGEAVQARGQSERACALFEEGLALATAAGDRWVAALSLGNLAFQALLTRQPERAAAQFAASLVIRQDLKDTRGMAGCLEGMAILAELMGRPERAVRLFGATEIQMETIGASLTFVISRADSDRSVTAVRAVLGDAVFAALWQEGRAMTLDHAIDYALEPPGEAH